MTIKLAPVFVAISAIAIHSGCTLESGIAGEMIDPEVTLLQPAGIAFGGQTANGEVYGFGRVGTEILGQDSHGVTPDGRVLTHLGLMGSSLVSADLGTGEVLKGSDLVGITFQTIIPSMDPIEVRIEALEVRPALKSDHAVHRYTIAYNLVHEPGWTYACGVDRSGVPIKAIPLEELWDYRQGVPGGGSRLHTPGWVTFACEGFALAECVDLGYLAWNVEDGHPPTMYHQACTRMIRADYCGDGRSFSPDYAMVDVYDARGIQTLSVGTLPNPWYTEAEWTEHGARCVRRGRSMLIPFNACPFEIPKKLCGSPPHWDRTLLVSQMPSPPS
jgi:hypothetical protein